MKIKSILAAVLLFNLTLVSSVLAEEQNDDNYHYNFSIDRNNQTAFTGADLSFSMIETYRFIDDKLAPQEDSIMNLLMIIPRFMITRYISTFQHEVFGHGARVREIGQGWKVTGYEFNLDTSGLTKFLANPRSAPQYMIATTIAGMQANEVLANKIKSSILHNDTINPVYGAAYFHSAFDQINYVFGTDYKEKSSSNDVQSYIKNMNLIYGNNYLSASKLKANTALGLLDPFLYYSAYALVTGKDFEYPMIEFGDYKYLPAFRGIFTPYGLESKWLNHFKNSYTPFQINFSKGKHKTGTSLGAEVIIDKITEQGHLDIGCNLAIWKQPKLFYLDPLKAPNKRGYSFEMNLKLNLDETKAIYSAFGYKTAGFRLGYPLKATPLIRVGLAFKL